MKFYFFLPFFLSISLYAQNDTDLEKIFEQIRKMRSEFMQDFNSRDFAQDFQDIKDSFDKSQSSFMSVLGFSASQSGDMYQLEWKDDKEGKILEVIPKDKETELSISVKDDFVTIKGKKVAKGNDKSIKDDMFMGAQQFEYSQNVPYELDASKNKITEKDGKISIAFPWKNGIKRSTVSQSLSATRRAELREQMRAKKRKERGLQHGSQQNENATETRPLFDAQKEDVI